MMRGGNIGKRASSAPRARWSARAMRTRSKKVKSQCGCGVTCSLMRPDGVGDVADDLDLREVHRVDLGRQEVQVDDRGLGAPCITKGGFSMTSWPTFTMQSARVDCAVHEVAVRQRRSSPSQSGCVSSTTPLPIRVLRKRQTHAIDERPEQRERELAVPRRRRPSPAAGGRARWPRRRARSTSRRPRGAGRSLRGWAPPSAGLAAPRPRGAEVDRPGRSCCGGPERLAHPPGIASAATIERVYLVSGRIMTRTSTIWKSLLARLDGLCR